MRCTVQRGRPSGSGKLAPYREMLIAKGEQQPDITMPEQFSDQVCSGFRELLYGRDCI